MLTCGCGSNRTHPVVNRDLCDQGATTCPARARRCQFPQPENKLHSTAQLEVPVVQSRQRSPVRVCLAGQVTCTFSAAKSIASCPQLAALDGRWPQVLRPGGRLILLEHGRSSWDWVNRILDSDARRHYSNWGCWWNRDMLAIVAEVRHHQ